MKYKILPIALALVCFLSGAAHARADGSLDPTSVTSDSPAITTSCTGPEDGYYVFDPLGNYQQANSCGNAFNAFNAGVYGTGHVVFINDYASQSTVCSTDYTTCSSLAVGIVNDAPFDITDPSPPPPSPGIGFAGLIDSANSDFASTTGFTIGASVGFVNESLTKLFIGSGLSLLYELRYWIMALIIIAGVIYFAWRAIRLITV